MTFWKWSKTAASNGTADSTCPFPEGMAASAVNDGVRGAMAALAKWRDDISGAITTSGSSTAYTVSSNQNFDTLAHMDNAMIAFVPHTTNGAAPTLAVDGLTAKKIRMVSGEDIPDGVLIEGTPYVATYYNTAGEFVLHGLAGNPYGTMLGGLMYALDDTPPNSSFVLPYGQAISRTTYATLFAKISTRFGSGDGSTTFNLPDLRGRVIAGLDNMGGTSANRLTDLTDGVDGDTIGATGGKESATLAQANLPSVNFTVSIPSGQGSHTHAYVAPRTVGGLTGGGAFSGVDTGVNATTPAATLPAMSGTAASGGSGTALNNIQPTIVLPCFVRVI